LENENKRKSVYDILNIFYDDSEIIFANEGDILILENKVIFIKRIMIIKIIISLNLLCITY